MNTFLKFKEYYTLKKTQEIHYYWHGITLEGQQKHGIIRALNRLNAHTELRKQGILLRKLTKKHHTIFLQKHSKIKTTEIAIFFRQFSTLIQAEIPIIQLIELLIQGSINQNLRGCLSSIQHDIEIGLSLSEAMQKHSHIFSRLICNLIKAGEQSGTLSIMLNDIAHYLETNRQLKKRIQQALIYPCTVLIMSLLITITLLITVVPQFEELFNNFHAQLPLFTRAIIYISTQLQHTWYSLLFLVIVGCYLMNQLFIHSMVGKKIMNHCLLRLPFLGLFLKKTYITRFTHSLAITFKAGIPITDALNVINGVTGNYIYDQATQSIKKFINRGDSLQSAIEHTELFPRIVGQMIGLGEVSGQLGYMLQKVADYYERDIEQTMETLPSILEPAIMVLLGVILGTLVIAMYLPIYQLGSII